MIRNETPLPTKMMNVVAGCPAIRLNNHSENVPSMLNAESTMTKWGNGAMLSPNCQCPRNIHSRRSDWQQTKRSCCENGGRSESDDEATTIQTAAIGIARGNERFVRHCFAPNLTRVVLMTQLVTLKDVGSKDVFTTRDERGTLVPALAPKQQCGTSNGCDDMFAQRIVFLVPPCTKRALPDLSGSVP